MSDEFDRRDWVEDLNEGIRNRDTWFRGLKIVVLLFFIAVARLAMLVTVAYQFCFCLVRNRPSEIMLPVGRWLARYVEKTILFMTWNSDHAPFPFTHINRVMEQEPDYRDEEPVFQAADEGFAEEEERYEPEPLAPPPTEDEVADDEPGADEQTGEEGDEEPEPEDDEGQSRPPPRPDA
jgi:hypothetical protein